MASLQQASPGRGLGFTRASARPGSAARIRVRGVEGWRAIAALAIIVFHVWQTMGGDSGIGPWVENPAVALFFLNVDLAADLFFVLSGLLLFLPFASAALDDDEQIPSGRVFWYRRFLRVYPLYLVVVLAAWFPRNYGALTAEWADLVQHLFLVQAYDSAHIFNTIGPAWTLSVEMTFYVVLALTGAPFVRWVRRNPLRRARLIRLLVPMSVGVAASVLFKVNLSVVWDIPVTDWAWRFGPAARADEFLIGMGFAAVIAYRRGAPFRSGLFFPILLAGCAVIVSVLYRDGQQEADLVFVYRHTAAALGWGLVLFAFIGTRSPRPAALIDNRLLLRVGIYTYAAYLVHEPIILAFESAGWFTKDPTGATFAANVTMTLLGTAAAAWMLHRLVEEPWTDAATLQAPRGGRADLYPHLAAHAISASPSHPARLLGHDPDSPSGVVWGSQGHDDDDDRGGHGHDAGGALRDRVLRGMDPTSTQSAPHRGARPVTLIGADS